MGYGKSKPGMFKMKHSGVAALMKSLTGGQKEMVSKMREQGKASAADKIEKGILAQPEKAAAKKYGDKVLRKDPTDKKKTTTARKKTAPSSSNSMFPERGTVEERRMREAYKNASPQEQRRMKREFQKSQTAAYSDEGYNQMRAKEKKLTAKYKTQFGDPAEKGISSEERLSRMDAIRSNVAKDVGRADYRTNMNSKDSPEYSQAMSGIRAENERLGKIFDLHMQGKSWNKYKKQPTETAGAAPKKVGVGSKSIKQRIQEDAKKKKNAPKRATMTKKMYKK